MNLFNDPVNHMKNMLLYGKVSSNDTVPQLNVYMSVLYVLTCKE